MNDNANRELLVVDELVRMCNSCSDYCRIASQSIEDSWLSKMFKARAESWQLFGDALSGERNSLNSRHMASIAILRTLNRASIKIKSALNDDRVIASDCAEQEGFSLLALQSIVTANSCRRLKRVIQFHLRNLSRIELSRPAGNEYEGALELPETADRMHSRHPSRRPAETAGFRHR